MGLTLTAPESMWKISGSMLVGAVTTGKVLYAMRNTSTTKTCLVRRLKLRARFHGTAAETSSIFMWQKFDSSAATNYSGGTAVTPARLTSGYTGTSAVTDASHLLTGLTATTMTVKGGPLFTFSVPSINPTIAVPHWEDLHEFNNASSQRLWDRELTLSPGTTLTSEGLSLGVIGTTIASVNLEYEVVWTETA